MFDKDNAIEGKILTGFLIGAGVFIAIKNHKKEGFWLGVGALFLMGCSIKIYSPKK